MDQLVQKIQDSLKVFRIREVLPGIGPVIVAAIDSRQITPGVAVAVSVGYVSLFFSSFLINEFFDSFDTDRFNLERGKAIISHQVTRKFTLVSFFVTALTGLLILTRLKLFVPALTGLILLTAYSVPLIRIKSRPILDLITVTIGFIIIPYLSYYFLANVQITLKEVLALLFFAFGFCAIDLVAEGADLEADQKAGLTTTAVYLGVSNNIFLMRIFSLLCIVFGVVTVIYTGRWWYIYPLAMIFFLHTASNYALSIKDKPGRVHELFSIGGKFGIIASDIGVALIIAVFILRYFIP